MNAPRALPPAPAATPAVVLDAVSTLRQLHTAGWQIVALEYLPEAGEGTITAESPGHRVVTVSANRSTGHINRQQVSGSAAMFLVKGAHDVAYLGHLDATAPRPGTSLLGQLRALAAPLGAARGRGAGDWLCVDPLPMLSLWASAPSRT